MAPMKATYPRVSFADLEPWPEDGRRYELYDGEVYEVPSLLPLHQMAAARLHLALSEYVRGHGGLVLFAPLDIVLTEYDVVQPDLLLFTRERQHLVNPRKVTRVQPDLAIEISSPGTAGNDRGRRMRLLARHGVREFWLVDPDALTVEIDALTGEQFVLAGMWRASECVHSPLLPELSFARADLLTSDF
jgi:Uma2 family endonuclease